MILELLVSSNFGKFYDYRVPKELKESIDIGSLVKVPFGSKVVFGIVMSIKENSKHDESLKYIISHIAIKEICPQFIDFIKFYITYNFIVPGFVFRQIIPELKALEEKYYMKYKNLSDIEQEYLPEKSPYSFNIELSENQKHAKMEILNSIETRMPIVLHGVTGSGKTELYLSIISDIIQNPTQKVLILEPEIGITYSIINRIQQYGNYPIALWNSNLTPSQRRKYWLDIMFDKANIIIGARSALLLPIPNLSMIIVDEEHDFTYKQNSNIYYQGRDMAVARSHFASIPIILATATPSIETYYNIQRNKYRRVMLQNRYKDAEMPRVEICDMKTIDRKQKYAHILSKPALEAIRKNLEQKQQTLLYLNRRGYARILFCDNCDFEMKCPECDISMSLHTNKESFMLCHYCEKKLEIPSSCPTCFTKLIRHGVGIEKLEEAVKYFFPDTSSLLLASDTVNNDLDQSLKRIANGEIDIILGTQILAKGHHIPALSLVIVIDTEIGLYSGDFRASERVYQLLTQVSGRAGRVPDLKSRVILQTRNPDNDLLSHIANYDMEKFLQEQLNDRMRMNMPPFCQFVKILFMSTRQKELETFLINIQKSHNNIMGPLEAYPFYVKKIYRYKMIVSIPRHLSVPNLISKFVQELDMPKHISYRIDVNPYEM